MAMAKMPFRRFTKSVPYSMYPTRITSVSLEVLKRQPLESRSFLISFVL